MRLNRNGKSGNYEWSFLRLLFWLPLALALTACGGGGSSGSAVASSHFASDEPTGVEGPSVTLSGRVTFEYVPPQQAAAGLDYANSRPAPARGLVVQALSADGEVVASGETDANGYYQVEVPAASDIRIRALARMKRNGSPSWLFSVTDNTKANALYALDGSLADTGETDSERDLHAPAGWDGSSYTEVRAAAPFAVLDAVYEAVQRVLSADGTVQFPPLELRWSAENSAVSGEFSEGAIGTSFYSIDNQSIYLLGQADNDTDEYDRSVILHEFAHYLEDQLGRTDSIGGSHSATAQLDMRVAFSEGWGNAFASMTMDDPLYRDSIGQKQGAGFSFSVEDNDFGNYGWFSENSVHKILYNLYDETNNGTDQASLGFAPIYQTLTGRQFREFAGATSIFAFVEALKARAVVDPLLVDDLLDQESIAGQDGFGSGEANGGGLDIALPIYHQLTLSEPVEVCSGKSAGEHNGLDVRRFARFELHNQGTYRITAEHSQGMFPSQPDFILWRQGELLLRADSLETKIEQRELALDAGAYWLEIYEQENIDRSPSTGGLTCFTLTLTSAP